MSDRLLELLDAYLENRLDEVEAGELRDQLRVSPEARRLFWEYVEQHALLEDVLGEVRGRDLALFDVSDPLEAPAIALVPSAAIASSKPGRWRWFPWVGVLAALAATVLLVVWWQSGASRQPDAVLDTASVGSVGTVELVAGDIRVIDPSGTSVVAAPGLPLRAGQVIAAGDEQSMTELRLADGTDVTLSSGSSLRLPSLDRAAQPEPMRLERGAIQLQVPQRKESSPLVVATDHGRIVSNDARFRVYREENALRIELVNGLVSLVNRADDRVLDIPESSFVVVTNEPNPMVPQPLSSVQCRLRHTYLKAGNSLAISHDGSLIAASHHKHGLRVWNVDDGKLLATAPGIREPISGMAFGRNNQVVTALSQGGTALFWKVGDAAPSHTRLRDTGLRQSTVSGDGRWLAQGSGAGSGEVAIWEVDPELGSVSLRRSLPIKPSRVALSNDGAHVAVNEWAGETSVVEVLTGRKLAQHKLAGTATLALSADGQFLAACSNKEGLVLLDQRAGSRQTLWACEGARVSHLQFSADGRVLLAALNDGTVRAWASDTGRSLLVLETGHRAVLRATASTDLSVLATLGDNDCVKVWECKLP